MLFGTWLRSARARQRDEGLDHRELATYASELTPYVRDQLSAALYKLETLYIRLPPEALSDEKQRQRWLSIRQEYIRQARIALDHLANTLAVIGCTDEELENALSVPEKFTAVAESASEEPEEDEQKASDITVQIPVPLGVGVGQSKEDK